MINLGDKVRHKTVARDEVGIVARVNERNSRNPYRVLWFGKHQGNSPLIGISHEPAGTLDLICPRGLQIGDRVRLVLNNEFGGLMATVVGINHRVQSVAVRVDEFAEKKQIYESRVGFHCIEIVEPVEYYMGNTPAKPAVTRTDVVNTFCPNEDVTEVEHEGSPLEVRIQQVPDVYTGTADLLGQSYDLAKAARTISEWPTTFKE